MNALISLLTLLVSLGLAFQVGRQFASRRRAHQLVWTIALTLFAVGAGCQFLAGLGHWSPLLYRLWYLSGAILTAAYLGQGTVYLMARRKVAHLSMAMLALGSVYALIKVFGAPVDLNQALTGIVVSGKGMPPSVRLMTPFFNIFGTLTTVGGALMSTRYFLWNGGSSSRAAGTACIAVGAFIVAMGGTLARFSVPEALYITELLGISVIFCGFSLTARPSPTSGPNPEKILQRRKRITQISVGLGAAALLGAVVALPILPWGMGIVTQVKHVYTNQLPVDNRGAYLITDNGVMELFAWYVEPPDFPTDAPVLDAAGVKGITIIQKQFDQPENYRLYNLDTGQPVSWRGNHTEGMHLSLDPGSLSTGNYELIVPSDSMFGGYTWHFFTLQ